MEPQPPKEPADTPGLPERVARLEAQVAWLLQRQGVVQAPPLPHPRPIVRQAKPAREVSPVAWIAGIAAAIFLIGTIFFLRWAIQQGWVGAELRFALGLLVGGGISSFAAKRLLGDSRRLGVALLLAGLGTLQFTFRAGTTEYHFYAISLGLVATVFITLVAGTLAARSRSGGALTVALVSGLAAPLVFSPGGHHEVALATYLAVLLAAALAVPYMVRSGGAWHGLRWTALLGVWLLLSIACQKVGGSDASSLGAILILHLILASLWAWLPGLEEVPGTPTLLWLVASVLATSDGWLLWRRMGLAAEAFALPVIAVAVLNLALVLPLRRRMGSRSADWGLLALAVGHLALAVPVALAWNWVGPIWGTFALCLAWVSMEAEAGDFAQEAGSLRWLAAALALLTTLRWTWHALGDFPFRGEVGTPFCNSGFAEGTLAAAAWWLLARRGGPLGLLAFLGFEVTANVTLAFEAARLVQNLQTGQHLGWGLSRGASVTMTLVWALSGGWQWMWSLGQRQEVRRALMIAGYVWMGVAGLKLIASDLDRADTPLRALAFLGVGGIGMAAAILANRQRSDRKE
jgi:uncharacterized membrane protein